jgi:hypothetical protein
MRTADAIDGSRAQLAEPLDVEVLPASSAQQGIWIACQFEPDSAAYNIAIGLRLKGQLRSDVLKRSLEALVVRHESLRTTFELRRALLVQCVSRATNFGWSVKDLSSCTETEIEVEAYANAEAEVAKPLDLKRGPLLRALLLKLRPGHHVLICTVHHIISDAWSAGVFVQELISHYEAFSSSVTYRPEALQLQYGDCAIWQREYLGSDVFQRQLAYWKKKLAGTPPVLELPYDHRRPAGRTSGGARQTMLLDPELVGRLKIAAQHNGTTFFTVMLAAFNVLLYRYSGQTDILIGVPAACRSHVETEPLIGLFVNTLVLRTDLSGNPEFSTLLAQVSDSMLEALANQDVPIDRLTEELQPVRNLSYNPLFQVTFGAFKGAVQTKRFADLEAHPYVVNTTISAVDLSLALIEGSDEQYWIQLDYSASLFNHDRISRLLGHYEQILISAVRAAGITRRAY